MVGDSLGLVVETAAAWAGVATRMVIIQWLVALITISVLLICQQNWHIKISTSYEIIRLHDMIVESELIFVHCIIIIQIPFTCRHIPYPINGESLNDICAGFTFITWSAVLITQLRRYFRMRVRDGALSVQSAPKLAISCSLLWIRCIHIHVSQCIRDATHSEQWQHQKSGAQIFEAKNILLLFIAINSWPTSELFCSSFVNDLDAYYIDLWILFIDSVSTWNKHIYHGDIEFCNCIVHGYFE